MTDSKDMGAAQGESPLLQDKPSLQELSTSQPRRLPDEEGDIVAEKSCETGTTLVDQIKVAPAIGQNEEEFKEINETVQ